MMRQRSRDAQAGRDAWNSSAPDVDDPGLIRRRRRVPRKAIILLAVTSTLLLAFALLQRFQWRIPSPTLSVPTKHDGLDTENSKNSPGSFILHPQHHKYRAAATIEEEWRITSCEKRPDGVLKRVYCLNEAFPGPTLEARSGDHLVITVVNGLEDEELSLHWHGLSMRGANDMDGAVGITQGAILPGANFTYTFDIENHQHGTFWWHAHHGVQRADGIYGGLVVHEPAIDTKSEESKENEYLLLVGDWYHRPAEAALKFYMHPGSFGNEAVPDSILLNGHGAFNCKDAVPARPLDCQVQLQRAPSFTLSQERRNIFRVVNVGSYAGVNLAMPGSVLQVLAVDGGNTVSSQLTRSIGTLHPGERIDVLVQSDRSEPPHSLNVTLDDTAFKYENPALSLTHQFPLASAEKSRPTRVAEQVVETIKLNQLSTLELEESRIPQTADDTIVLYAVTQKLAHLSNTPHGFINNTSWQPQGSPSSPLNSLPRDQWDKNQFVPRIRYESRKPRWVDIVLNNLDEEGHPFHLHGYNFWVLSTYTSTFNWGSYNPYEDEAPPGGAYNIQSAIAKDTVYVPRRGYAVLRLLADNPGLWMFHCHVLWHQASGMAMAIEVG